MRIRAKRCRYAAELAEPGDRQAARATSPTALTRVQDVLGEHQDAVVADGWLAKTAPECSPAEAYALGMLAEIERGRERARPGRVRERVGRGARTASCGRGCDAAPRLVRAAGGVVTRPAPDGGVEVLVVHRPRYDDWSLPEGQGRARRVATRTPRVREVEEETGYRCTLGAELPTVRYLDRQGRQKQVRFWQMTVDAREPHWCAERRGRRAPLDFADGSRDTAQLRRRPPTRAQPRRSRCRADPPLTLARRGSLA